MGQQMDRLELLKKVSFGARVAEEEINELETYFVETDEWYRLFQEEVDIIKGDKGAGKSAIYSLLMAKANELFDKRILVISAEHPRGAPVFKELITDPPASEPEFVGLWKLYILTLLAQAMSDYGINNEHSRELRRRLADQGFIDSQFDLAQVLKATLKYAKRYFTPKLEASVTVDPITGFQTYAGKITPGEPDRDQVGQGFISVDRLAGIAEKALEDDNFQIWVLLDRLDVAFAETHELEKNALRALFRVYRDFAAYDHIKLKIFIRSDIWKRIVDEGFREASHITKDVVLEWSQNALLNLIVRRVLKNDVIVKEYDIEKGLILRDAPAQSELFYRIFPKQVDQGPQKPPTLAWLISRCADGTTKTAPREVIHLLNTAREEEAKRIQHGEPSPPENRLFDKSVFKLALPTVSRARLTQTVYAEYPDVEPFLAKLKGEKTEHSVDSLAALWKLSNKQALVKAEELVEIGFFQRRGSRDAPAFWVPFLYRDALEMVQGKADTE
jgi:hypothetical protein